MMSARCVNCKRKKKRREKSAVCFASIHPNHLTHPNYCPRGAAGVAVNYDVSWWWTRPTWRADPGALLNIQQLPLFTTEAERFAWRPPGGQLHSPDEMRLLSIWDSGAHAAISTPSYYVLFFYFFFSPLTALPAFHSCVSLLTCCCILMRR